MRWFNSGLALALLGLASCHGRGDVPGGSSSTAAGTAGKPGVLDTNGSLPCDRLGFVPCQRQVVSIEVPIAGTAIRLTYASDRVPGRKVDSAPDAGPIGLGGWSLSVLRSLDTTSHVMTTGPGKVRQVIPQGAQSEPGALAVIDADGQRADVFDLRGNDLSVYDARTAARRLTFVWDAHGLKQVIDRSGVALSVVRDASGAPLRLEARNGARTELRTRGGWLSAIRSAVASTTVTTNRSGLVTQVQDANGALHGFEYDDVGRLVSSTDPNGARTTFTRSQTVADLSVTVAKPNGGHTIDAVHVDLGGSTTFTHTAPGGIITRVDQSAAHSSVALPDGRKIDIHLEPDAQWAMDLPLLTSMSITDPGALGLALSISEKRSGRRALDKPQPWSDVVTINGKTWNQDFDPARRTLHTVNPAGRGSLTTFDALGRITASAMDGEAGRAYDYDTSGRLSRSTLGASPKARVWKYQYSDAGDVTISDPLGRSSQRHFNAAGLLEQVVGPGTLSTSLTRDRLSRIAQFTGAGQGDYRIVRRKDGRVTAITAPAGDGAPEYMVYDYDIEGQISGLASGDMKAVLARDEAGRITSVDYGSGRWSLAMDALGRITQAARGGTTLSETYQGSDLVGQRVQGPFDIEVKRTRDAFGHLKSETVGNTSPVEYDYDDASLLTRAGHLQITRDPHTGRVSEERLGAVKRTWTYDRFGAALRQTVVDDNGRVIVDMRWQRDAMGRVLQQSLRMASAPAQVEQDTYDAQGRLATWTDGSHSIQYGYDEAGNQKVLWSSQGTSTSTRYNPRNELIGLGNTQLSYNGAGQLSGRKDQEGVTSYRYDLGNALISVTRPDMTRTDYVVDADGRRLASLRDGKLQYGIVYGDAWRPSAELGADGSVTTRYVYAGGTSPAYVTRNQADFLEVLDNTSSPRVIINAATGTVVDAIARAPYGQVLSETAPGFQLVGFAGGIVDTETGFVRFGARDYDPRTARWTSPDPLGIRGGSPNLYTYANSDPVNLADPSGLLPDLQPDVGQVGVTLTGAGTPVGGTLGAGVVFGGGQVGIYATGGLALGAQAGVNVTGTGIYSDTGSHSIDQVSGTAAGVDLGFGPGSIGGGVGSGTETGTVGIGPSLGLSGSGTYTMVGCVYNCNPGADDGPRPVNDDNPDPNCRGMDAGLCDPTPASPNDPDVGLPDDPNSPTAACSIGGTCNDDGSAETNPYMLSARGNGEPHLSTLDGVLYDLMAVGEFTALRSDTGDFVVQFRQAPLGLSRTISFISAVAVNALGDRISMNAQRGGQIHVDVNGSPQLAPSQATTLPHGARLSRTATEVRVRFPDQSTLIVRRNPAGLDFVALLPDGRKNTLHGLLGQTGSRTVQSHDGKSFSSAQLDDFDTRYRQFADSWRITQSESLLHYESGETTATYTDMSFPDQPPQLSAAQRSSAEQLCGSMALPAEAHDACVLDVAMTGDAGYAASTFELVSLIPGTMAAKATAAAAIQVPAVGNRIHPGDSVHGHVEANGATRYDLDVNGDSVGYFAAALACNAKDSLRWSIQSDDGSGGDDQSICRDIGRRAFSQAGHYHLIVYGYQGGAGDYGFTWKPSRPEKLLSMTVGTDAAGTIELPGAQDAYELQSAAGGVGYFAATSGCDSAVGARWRIEFRDSGRVLQDSALCSDVGRIAFPLAEHYVLTVYSYQGGTGAYRVKWIASRPDQALAIKAGDALKGRIDLPGAADRYAVQASAGDVAYFKATPDCVRNSGLRWSIGSDPSTPGSGDGDICSDLGRITFSNAGRYQLRVYSYAGATGDYRVQWIASRPDKPLSLRPTDTADGNIDLPGAADVYSIDVKAGDVGYFKAAPGCVPTSGIRWRVDAGDSGPALGDTNICIDLGKIMFNKAGRYQLRVYSNDGGIGGYRVLWSTKE
jgi:RHS repeat-associated protein